VQESFLNLILHPLFLLSLGVIFALIANFLRDRRLERQKSGLPNEALRDEQALQEMAGVSLPNASRANPPEG